MGLECVPPLYLMTLAPPCPELGPLGPSTPRGLFEARFLGPSKPTEPTCGAGPRTPACLSNLRPPQCPLELENSQRGWAERERGRTKNATRCPQPSTLLGFSKGGNWSKSMELVTSLEQACPHSPPPGSQHLAPPWRRRDITPLSSPRLSFPSRSTAASPGLGPRHWPCPWHPHTQSLPDLTGTGPSRSP